MYECVFVCVYVCVCVIGNSVGGSVVAGGPRIGHIMIHARRMKGQNGLGTLG